MAVSILLIDDDEDYAALIRALLADALVDCHLDWQPGYAAALEDMLARRHDLYLVDYRLGARSGLDLIRECLDTGVNMPIILMTGQGDRSVDMEAMRLGAYDYLNKAGLTAASLERSLRYALERDRQLREIQRSRRLMEKMLGGLDEAVFSVDPASRRILHYNPVAMRMFHLDGNSPVGWDVVDFFPDREVGMETWASSLACLEINTQHQAEVWLGRRDGSLFPAEWYASPVRDEQGVMEQIVLVIRDVGEERRLQENARMHQEAFLRASRLATMGEMAAALAHEINQPLAAISNYSQGCVRRLEASGTGDRQALEALKEITQQAQRAGMVIQRIREFVGNREAVRHPHDLNEVAEEIFPFVLSEPHNKEASISLELSTHLPAAVMDRIQIGQVILNLVRNGVDAARGCDNAEVLIRTAFNNSNEVELTVADTGMGIDPAVMPRIFEPFFTTKSEGMGMGLAICRNIVEAHGGRIWCTPNQPCGTVFHVALPVHERGSK
jgi:PAS domain S-box-containing protein